MTLFAPLSLGIALLLGFCAVLTSTISGVIGMAGGILLLSLMSLFLPYASLIPIHGVVQLVSNSSRAFLLRSSMKKSVVFPFLFGAPFGTFLSSLLLQRLEDETIPMVLLASFIFYAVFKPKKLPPLRIKDRSFFFLGIFSGALGVLVGATGPFLAPFFLREDWDKKEIIATKASLQVITHVLKIPAFLFLGFSYIEFLPLILLLCFAAIFGTKIGVGILGKINEKLFFRLFRFFLVLIALRLLYKGLMV